VGVTGTNGKTTIANLLFKLFTSLGHVCGLISTVQNQIAEKIIPTSYTTPDAITLTALLKQMHEEGCEYVFMECSSHMGNSMLVRLHFYRKSCCAAVVLLAVYDIFPAFSADERIHSQEK
jgi:UDP-N-acetylmuramyl tripeptide synthase